MNPGREPTESRVLKRSERTHPLKAKPMRSYESSFVITHCYVMNMCIPSC